MAKKKKTVAQKEEGRTAFVMLVPMVGLLSIFVIIPLIYAVYVSFYQWNFYGQSTFIGLQNFKMVIEDPKFWNSIMVGLKFSLIVVPVQFVLAFLFANLIKAVGDRFGGFLKAIVYIPNVIAGVVASTIFIFIYDYDGGIANAVTRALGLGKINWLSNIHLALGAIAAPAIWLGFGMTTLVMLAGLNDIPRDYYEAATVDGASWWHQMWSITIPLMKNIFLYLLVMGFTGAIQQFDLPYMMTQGGPLDVTMTPNLFIYGHFTNDPYLGYTVASSLILFVILGTMSLLIFRIFNGGSRHEKD